jgi:hypothetical protein
MNSPIVASLVLLLPACSKTEPSREPPSTKPAAVTPDARPAARSSSCGAGATKVEQLGFCITLPADYTIGTLTADRVELENKETEMNNLTVVVTDGKLDDFSGYDVIMKDNTEIVKGSGQLLDGKGKWIYATAKTGTGFSWGVYVAGPKKLITCELTSNADEPNAIAKLDICKTITPLKP